MNLHRVIVLFDAVGTVIKPVPGAVDVYHELGAKHGCRMDRNEIQRRMLQARHKYFYCGASSSEAVRSSQGKGQKLVSLVSSDELEFQLWNQVVCDVFDELSSWEILFQELWEYFASPDHWQVYRDVRPCWELLTAMGIGIGLASNFDSRLLKITSALLPDVDLVFYSAQIGYRKPSPQFYRGIEKKLSSRTGVAAHPRLLMVGDDFENDYAAPKLAGWSSIWLNRTVGDPAVIPANSKESGIHSLDELMTWVAKTIEADDG